MCNTISSRLHALSFFKCDQKIIVILEEGPRQHRLSADQLAVVSEKLKKYKGKMPSEFAKQPRGLDEVKKWKATEYDNFFCILDILFQKVY